MRDKAISIAIGTFLSEFEHSPVETYEKLCSEPVGTNWSDVDYATPWFPFEDLPVAYAVEGMEVMVEAIMKEFGENL